MGRLIGVGLSRFFFGRHGLLLTFVLPLLFLFPLAPSQASSTIDSVDEARSLVQKNGPEEVTEDVTLRNFIEQINPNDAEVIASLPQGVKARALGALKAGFVNLEKVGPHYTMMRNEKDLVMQKGKRLLLMVSFSKPRNLKKRDFDRQYLSVISELEFECSSNAVKLIRQEFKESKFGTGATILALLRTDGNETLRFITSPALVSYFKKYLCQST